MCHAAAETGLQTYGGSGGGKLKLLQVVTVAVELSVSTQRDATFSI
jgi:hypothetical protein